ncbi:MAG: hypothetical protein JO073_04155 [Actinobacteria bacterium]|nr:hypothetical protein [Actinomycetota bacterium]
MATVAAASRGALLQSGDLREAIFGSFDDMTSTLGVAAGLLAVVGSATYSIPIVVSAITVGLSVLVS